MSNLIKAAKDGNLAKVTELLNTGADVNFKSDTGVTPLIAASAAGRLNVVKALVDKGANLNIQGPDNYTALAEATDHNFPDIVSFLIEKGANLELKEANGFTPLLIAGHRGYGDIAKRLIDAGADVNAKNDYDTPPLFFECRSDHLDNVKLLLEKGAAVNAQTRSGATALIMAAANGNVEILKVLLDKGADITLSDSNGIAPLTHAVMELRMDAVQFLLEKGADIDVLDNFGQTPLIHAVIEGSPDVVKFLLEKGAKRDIKDKDGKTAVDYAETDEILKLIDPSANVGWKGYTKGDVDLLHTIFENPANISVCPVCLQYAERRDGCMYMKHVCGTPRHERLYNLFKDERGHIEWCTLCGRITNGEHHHYVLSLPQDTKRPDLAVVKPTEMGDVRYFDKNCVKSGGGGHDEKIKRLNALLLQACELQGEVGTISKEEAITELVEEAWLAANSKTRAVKRILETKKFEFPCSFPENAEQTTRPPEAEFPDIPRPADEKDLTPIKHEAPDNVCGPEMGPHEDDRPVYQFRHKQPDGSINEHKDEYICGADLEILIRANDFTGLCPLNPETCKAKLYPEELKGIVTDAYYEVYRTSFNRVNAAKQQGGANESLFRPVENAECAMPPRAGKRLATYRKKGKKARRKTYRRH